MDDEKQKELKKFKILSVVGFFVISIIGTLLHFTFNLSNQSLILAPFSAVNESVWEHLKVAIMPTFLWTICELFILKYRPDNLWTSLILKITVIMVSIVIMFYLSVLILGTHNAIVSVIIFYISILLGQIVGNYVLNYNKVKNSIEEVSKYLVIAIFLLFVIFTFIPPKADIFKDNVTQTYGVFKYEY